ncbi:MAG: hypothetical protein AMK70_03950 [Nitrospira bacterium SG8_35_1]|nr:MAG: hypothetical protein AMK70_03950 [Nitrospira bacterium SG8_35_1]
MKIRFILLCILIFFTPACSQVNTGTSSPAPLSLEELSRREPGNETEIAQQRAFLGVAHRLIETDEVKQAEGSYGYLIGLIVPDSTADKMGLRPGDIIVEFDGINLDFVADDERKNYLSQYITLGKKFGDPISLKVLRQTSAIQVSGRAATIQLKNKKELEKLLEKQSSDEKLTVIIDNKIQVLNFTGILGQRQKPGEQDLPPNKDLFPEYEIVATPHIEFMNRLLDHYELQNQYQDIISRYSEDELWDDVFRLKLFRYLHRDPFKLVPVIEERTSKIAESGNHLSFNELLHEGADLLDITISSNSIDSDLPLQSQPYLDYILEIINTALEYRQKAFMQLSEEEVGYLEEQLNELFDRFSESYYIERPGDLEDRAHNEKIIELAQKVDFANLFKSALTLAALTDPQWLSGLQDVLIAEGRSPINMVEGVSGDVLYTLSSKAGPVIIGGTGRNIYKASAAVIIDLGGDDLYTGEAGLVHGGQQISAIFDLSGNDEYMATEFFAQGAGILGVGLLYDVAGDDFYVGTRFSQGSAVFGIGMLGDLGGNDRYFGQEFNQGVAFWGAGILLDAKGNDYYQSNVFAQGVGGVKGLGALLDNAGADFYFAGGRDKSSYGTSGVFKGSSQGLGIGFRGYTSGGIGLLLDGEGDDSFWAGNFSQGTGYFFGIGVIRNFGPGDDTYSASRYGQGASAHSAAGLLMDDEGNDRYDGYHIALQGAAWDLGIAALVDKKGNDTYHGSNGFSQAASSHNGMAFFIDEAGIDRYFGDQARADNNDYHGGSSLSFFIDGGGDHDIYSSGLNNSITMKGEFGIRADLKGTMPNTVSDENYLESE